MNVEPQSTSQPGEGAQNNRVDQMDVPAFKDWFGKSVAADGQGKPIPVYHGTHAQFSTFELGRETKNSSALGEHLTKRMGMFFTTDKTFASEFAKKGGTVLAVYLSVQNPIDLTEGYPSAFFMKHQAMLRENNLLIMRPEEMWEMFDSGFPGSHEFVAALKADGYDGAKTVEQSANGNLVDVFVAFGTEQIKSAIRNNDRLDPESSNVTNTQEDPPEHERPHA